MVSIVKSEMGGWLLLVSLLGVQMFFSLWIAPYCVDWIVNA